MKLVPTTSLNDAIKRMADGDTGAGSVIAILNRESPHHVLGYLRSLDGMGLYGHAIYDMYWKECAGDFHAFVSLLSPP